MMWQDPQGQGEGVNEEVLTDEEIAQAEREAEEHWQAIREQLARRARTAYSVADPVDFAVCVKDHMNIVDRAEMARAEVYSCPECGHLLKDRRTLVASTILGERLRLRQLWKQVTDAQGAERQDALRRFIIGMGEP